MTVVVAAAIVTLEHIEYGRWVDFAVICNSLVVITITMLFLCIGHSTAIDSKIASTTMLQ